MSNDNREWEGREAILAATGAVALLIWLVSWVLIGLARAGAVPTLIESVSVAAALGGVTITLFVGFFIYGGPDRMRASIVASFLIFYLVLATDLLVIGAFRVSLTGQGLAEDLLKTLGGALTTILSFYFVVKGVENATHTVQEKKTERASAEADRARAEADLAQAQSTPASGKPSRTRRA